MSDRPFDSQRMRDDLDNYITGHYGEDQFEDMELVCLKCKQVFMSDECDDLQCPDCGGNMIEVEP